MKIDVHRADLHYISGDYATYKTNIIENSLSTYKYQLNNMKKKVPL